MSLPITYGQLFIAPLLGGFLAAHPEIRLDLQMEDRFVDLIETGIDFAIRIGQLQDSTLIAPRLGATRLMAVTSPDYLARFGTPATPEELGNHNCLTYRHEHQRSTVWHFVSDGEQTAVAVTGNQHAESVLVLHDTAVGGIVIAMLPDFRLRRSLASGELVEVLAAYSRNTLGIYAVHTHHRPPMKVKAWLDYLAAHLAPDSRPRRRGPARKTA